MMGIYVRGMEMPANCAECPVNMEVCKRGYKYLLEHPELYDKRADDCPILPVPPHGRLIDADALLERANADLRFGDPDFHAGLWHAVSAIEDAPTIIPAEEGE